MPDHDFFFYLAERRWLEPPGEIKSAAVCHGCGRAIAAWEFERGGALWEAGVVLCGRCACICRREAEEVEK